MSSGFAGADEIVPDVAVLEAERGDGGKNALHELRAGFGLVPEAAFAPQHRGAQGALGRHPYGW